VTAIEQHPCEIEAIKQLKARYFRLMDTKQWDELRRVFTDDCVFEGTSRPYPGPDEFVAGTRERLDRATTVHHGHMPEIVLTGSATARGLWAMHDRIEFPEAADHGRGLNYGITGFGHYEEEYRKEGDEWKIALLRLTRLAVSPILEPTPSITERWLPSHGRSWLNNINE
jgi:hypothetical protein